MHNIIDELAREEMLDQMVPGRTDRRNRHALERAEEKRKKKLRERLNSQLKPCPFCGGPAKIIERTKPDGYCSYTVKLVRCEACHAQTEERTADGYYGEYCSDEEIAERWNRRWILR